MLELQAAGSTALLLSVPLRPTAAALPPAGSGPVAGGEAGGAGGESGRVGGMAAEAPVGMGMGILSDGTEGEASSGVKVGVPPLVAAAFRHLMLGGGDFRDRLARRTALALHASDCVDLESDAASLAEAWSALKVTRDRVSTRARFPPPTHTALHPPP